MLTGDNRYPNAHLPQKGRSIQNQAGLPLSRAFAQAFWKTNRIVKTNRTKGTGTSPEENGTQTHLRIADANFCSRFVDPSWLRMCPMDEINCSFRFGSPSKSYERKTCGQSLSTCSNRSVVTISVQ